MSKIGKVKIQKGGGGGGGGGAKDVSDDLAKMTNYEKAILREDIFEMLSQLEVMEEGTDKSEYDYLVLEKSDIPDMKAKSMGAAGHAINAEFAALCIPFRAIPFSTEEATKVAKVVKRGKHKGEIKDRKETDCLKIYRTGEEFDPGLYRTEDSGASNPYQQYTEGQKKRAEKWVLECKVEPEVLEKIGLTVAEAEEEFEEEE